MVRQLGGALQALFLAGPAHDLVALAEADARALGAVLVPEGDQLLVDLLDLVYDRLLSPVGEALPQLPTDLAQALDLGMDFRDRSSYLFKRFGRALIPARRRLNRIATLRDHS